MKVLALDLSLTAAGWARTAAAGWTVGTLHSKHEGAARLQDLLNQVVRLARGSDLVVVEGYSFGSAHQAHQLGELGGVIRLGLHQLRIPFVEMSPSQVKKLATGNGNAKKVEVFAEAIRRLEYAGSDHNQSDALWLLQAALIHYRLPGAVDLPKKHLAVLDKVEWPFIERAA